MSELKNEIKDVNFLIGGKAIFTVFNPQGVRYTYKVTKSKKVEGMYFIWLLTGPNNEHDYTYFGAYFPNRYEVLMTCKSKFKDDSLPVKVIRFAIRVLIGLQSLPIGYGIIHEGKCCRCAKPLTTPESIRLGIGPNCREKLFS